MTVDFILGIIVIGITLLLPGDPSFAIIAAILLLMVVRSIIWSVSAGIYAHHRGQNSKQNTTAPSSVLSQPLPFSPDDAFSI